MSTRKPLSYSDSSTEKTKSHKLQKLIDDLTSLDVVLRVENGQLVCKAPKNIISTAIKQQLTTHKKAICDLLQKQKELQKPSTVPLAYPQRRMWLIHQLDRTNPIYHVSGYAELTGKLNYSAVYYAIEQLVARHRILRTRIIDDENHEDPEKRLSQQVSDSIKIPFNIVDLEKVLENHEQAITPWFDYHCWEPFDLTELPQFRITLLRLTDNKHRLLYTLHHAIFDAWSQSILLRDFSVFYHAYLHQQPVQLPELEHHYTDYARWQHSDIFKQRLLQQQQYWHNKLAGMPQKMPLPYDARYYERPLYEHKSLQVARQLDISIDSSLAKQLTQFSQQQQTTVFTVMLTSFKCLLAKLTQQLDVFVGTAIAGRQETHSEQLIGFFANTIILRTLLSADDSFLQALALVKQTIQEGFVHQDYPFDELIKICQPARSSHSSPLVQIMFLYEQHDMQAVELSALQWHDLADPTPGIAHDFIFLVNDFGGELSLSLQYSGELYSEQRMRRFANDYVAFLAKAMDCAEQAWQQLLTDPLSNNKPLMPLPFNSIIQQLEAQCLKTPDAIALSDLHQQISYQQLMALVERIAQQLLKHGVQTEERVIVQLPNTINWLCSLLAVLKVGAVYVPMSTAMPKARCIDIVKQSQARFMIGVSASAENYACQLFTIQQLLQPIATQYAYPTIHPLQLAYVLFTSGSTGKPKGIACTHQALLNQFLAKEPYKHRVLANTTINFDVSLWEALWPLSCGATTIFGHSDMQSMYRQHITVVHLVPATLALFIEQCPAKLLHQLVWLITGGDKLTRTLANQVLALLPKQLSLFNAYGPSETTIGVSVFPCEQPYKHHYLPIGESINNVTLRVLDNSLLATPHGYYGELIISGYCLARGYDNDPRKTAESFVPDPYAAEPGSRCYKTRDICYRAEDEQLIITGRYDQQLKINGVRIEAEEISALLCQHPAVQQAVVTHSRRIEPNSRDALIAYVVLNKEQENHSQQATDYRQWLAVYLPEYMLPSAIIALSVLPLTEQGKIDYQQLPLPAADDKQSASNLVEHMLLHCYRKVLGQQQMGVAQSFFSLGGDSLAAVRISQLAKRYGLSVSPKDILTSGNVKMLIANDKLKCY